MSVPVGVDADRGPPMAIPLAHFVVGFGFLLAGAGLGVSAVAGVTPGLSRPAHVHLLLVGWVCVTIMGAMTQFVPVWSGVELHSRRLAIAQLGLVTVGLVGFSAALIAGRLGWLPAFGGTMLAGFWAFVYNVARSLWAVEELDETERHFALALGYFLVVTALGIVLAIDFSEPVLANAGLVRSQVVAAHATLAVFGVVLTTIVGALYQLATMFTQTELHGVDTTLQRVEEWCYPVGVVALAGGRLEAGRVVEAEWVARIGGALVLAGLLAFAVILARKLSETTVEQTPMLSRYAVVALALPLWALASTPAWLVRPTDPAVTFGPADAGHLLLAGVVGFVLLGTLYHVVPFIVWVRRYSDRVGLEAVPMIDDLYDDRLAVADFWLTLGGLGLVTVGGVSGVRSATLVGGVAATLGFAVVALNLVGVVVRHGPESLRIRTVGDPMESGEADGDERFP